ncbi:MAG: hypothetical protein ACJ741_10680 [Pyrinomonadaceae bacterium]
MRRTDRGRGGKLSRRAAWLLGVALSLSPAAGCHRAGTSQNAARAPKSDFEQTLDSVRRSPHVKIYVVRRKDNEPLQADDRDYIRHNTPLEVATWQLTKDERAAIAGANFDFEPKHFEALNKRFTVEDYTNK